MLWFLVGLWMSFIFVLSSQPDLSTDTQGGAGPRNMAKAAQAGLYFALGLLVGLTLAVSRARRPGWWTFVVVALYAISDEAYQAFVPNRGPSVADIALDVLSGLSGLSCVVAVLWINAKLRSRVNQDRA